MRHTEKIINIAFIAFFVGFAIFWIAASWQWAANGDYMGAVLIGLLGIVNAGLAIHSYNNI